MCRKPQNGALRKTWKYASSSLLYETPDGQHPFLVYYLFLLDLRDGGRYIWISNMAIRRKLRASPCGIDYTFEQQTDGKITFCVVVKGGQVR